MQTTVPSTGRNKVFLLLVGWLLLLALGLVAWQYTQGSARGWPADSLRLASFEKNGVRVVLHLKPVQGSQALLTATFTPLRAGFHVYSKDLPRTGVNGVGRPTLLELTSSSRLQARGELHENLPASESADVNMPGLNIYPPGPVTLALPVSLPVDQVKWLDDQVSVTYMACSVNGCLQPVIGQLIPIRIPAVAQPAAQPRPSDTTRNLLIPSP